jgi:hypothetical protein
MAKSSIGYGHNPYGHPHGGSPFKVIGGSGPYSMNVGYGIGDWAEEVTWRIIPEFYRAEDGTQGRVPEPLRGFVDAIKPLLNDWIKRWRAFPSLWDAQFVPLEQLNKLAITVGTEVDPTKNERLQRSEVLNQAFLILNKGTDLGWSILAAFEDLLVEIIPLWAENKEPGAALTPDAPTSFVPHFDDIPADLLPTDLTFSDQFALWPERLYLDEECRTYRLRLVFSPTDDPSQDFDPDVAGRIVERLLRFKPIHVEIDRITFDGLRGASQTWTVTTGISAESSAAGMWNTAIVAENRAASATWTQAITADTTP